MSQNILSLLKEAYDVISFLWNDRNTSERDDVWINDVKDSLKKQIKALDPDWPI